MPVSKKRKKKGKSVTYTGIQSKTARKQLRNMRIKELEEWFNKMKDSNPDVKDHSVQSSELLDMYNKLGSMQPQVSNNNSLYDLEHPVSKGDLTIEL